MNPPSTSGLRHRSTVLESQTSFPKQHRSVSYGAQGGGETPLNYIADVARQTRYKERNIYDVVVKDFRKLQATGQIFNNPMFMVEEEMKVPLIKYDASYVLSPSHIETNVGELSYVPSFQHSDPKVSRLIDNAIVDAYAGVSANDGNTLLWMGEMKETIKMLTDIGAQLKVLHTSTKKARLAWAKGKLSVKEQQGLTLAIIFGILPLEQQIADFMSGLFKTKQAKSRQTSRGFRTSTKSQDYWSDARGLRVREGRYLKAHSNWTEHVEIQVRAGVLYEIEIDELPWLSVIADPKQVVSTAYALARMSFVIDWFINVGGVLSAWAPAAGTKELSAWVTVEVTSTIVGTTTLSPDQSSGIIDPLIAGQSQFYSVKRTKWRKPVDRSDLAIFPPLDINLDVEKLLLLVLLFAKIKR